MARDDNIFHTCTMRAESIPCFALIVSELKSYVWVTNGRNNEKYDRIWQPQRAHTDIFSRQQKVCNLAQHLRWMLDKGQQLPWSLMLNILTVHGRKWVYNEINVRHQKKKPQIPQRKRPSLPPSSRLNMHHGLGPAFHANAGWVISALNGKL